MKALANGKLYVKIIYKAFGLFDGKIYM